MKYICVLFLVGVALAEVFNPDCSRPCPKLYAPVCGFNGVTYKIFNNKCLMEVHSCSDATPWTLTTMSMCERIVPEPCPLICPAIYAPVCGFNGDTYQVFDNECVLRSRGCTDAIPWVLTSMDKCPSSKPCPKICPLIYAPVCGFNGERYQIFGNNCALEATNCEDSYVWEVLSLEDCAAHGLKAYTL